MTSVASLEAGQETTLDALTQSIGNELFLVVITVSLAQLLRTYFIKPKPNKVKCSKSCPDFAVSSPHKASLPYKASQKDGCNMQRATHQVGGNPTQFINSTVELFMEQPSTRTAKQMTALYVQLSDHALLEAVKPCKCGVDEFYRLAMKSSIQVGQYELITRILDSMVAQEVARSLEFYEHAMRQLAYQKQYRLALAVYDRLLLDGLQPSEVTCSCLIGFAVEVGELQRAIGFFNHLASRTTPSIRAYMTVLQVHATQRNWLASVALINDMRQKGVALDSLVLNIALGTGVAAEELLAAEALLDEVETCEPHVVDTISYNTILKAHAKNNDTKKALELIKRMQARGLKPTATTFNTAIDAAVRGGQVIQAWQLLKSMRSSGLEPDKITCSTLVKSLVKDPAPEYIMRCLELVKQKSSLCDAELLCRLYQGLFEAAARSSQIDLLQKVYVQAKAEGAADKLDKRTKMMLARSTVSINSSN